MAPISSVLAFLLLVLSVVFSDQRVDYSNIQLVQTKVDHNTLILMSHTLDIWRSQPIDQDLYLVDFLYNTTEKNPIIDSMEVKVLDPSLQRTVQGELDEIRKILDKKGGNFSKVDEFFETFRPYEEWLVFFALIVDTYPEFVTQFQIGITFQGRPIEAFTITSPVSGNKPGIYLEALQHAREWLAPTSLMWVTIAMLEGYKNGNEEAKLLLDSIEWTIVPIVNIDGYIYTWTTERLWRKNRRLNSGNSYGVDLNRNWGPTTTWCTSGSSRVPTSDTYCGTAPFSEPESRSVSSYLNTKKGQIKAAIDFHTYGPLILWPWQYTYDHLPVNDYDMFETLGKNLETQIRSAHGVAFVSEQGSDLYPHSGGFIDYNWEVNDIISFTLEGRGNSFVAPITSIVPSGEESYAGVVELAKHVIQSYKD